MSRQISNMIAPSSVVEALQSYRDGPYDIAKQVCSCTILHTYPRLTSDQIAQDHQNAQAKPSQLSTSRILEPGSRSHSPPPRPPQIPQPLVRPPPPPQHNLLFSPLPRPPLLLPPTKPRSRAPQQSRSSHPVLPAPRERQQRPGRKASLAPPFPGGWVSSSRTQSGKSDQPAAHPISARSNIPPPQSSVHKAHISNGRPSDPSLAYEIPRTTVVARKHSAHTIPSDHSPRNDEQSHRNEAAASSRRARVPSHGLRSEMTATKRLPSDGKVQSSHNHGNIGRLSRVERPISAVNRKCHLLMLVRFRNLSLISLSQVFKLNRLFLHAGNHRCQCTVWPEWESYKALFRHQAPLQAMPAWGFTLPITGIRHARRFLAFQKCYIEETIESFLVNGLKTLVLQLFHTTPAPKRGGTLRTPVGVTIYHHARL